MDDFDGSPRQGTGIYFTHAVWLNPIPAKGWNEKLNYRARSINMIRKLFPMFELSVTGLAQAVKRLKVSN